MKWCASVCVGLVLLSCTRDAAVVPTPPEPPVEPTEQAVPEQAADPEPVPSVEPSPSLTPTTITVLTFSGTEDVFRELSQRFEARHPGVKVVIEAADLIDAIRRLGSDHDVDILVTEGATAMEVARPAGVVNEDSIRIVTHLPLTLTVAPSKRASLTEVSSLSQDGLRWGLLDPRISTGGRAAKRLVRRLALGGTVQQRVLKSGAATALESDVVDVFAGWGPLRKEFPTMKLPASVRELLPIPAALTKRTQRVEAANTFLDWSRSNEAVAVWRESGSVPTPSVNAPIVSTILPASLPSPRYWAGSVAVNNRILLVGGRVGNEDLNALVWFDPARTLCSEASAHLPTGRHGVAAVLLGTNRIVLAGGLSNDSPESDLFVYNPTDDRLDRQNVGLSVPVGRMATASFGETLLFFGGIGEGGEYQDTVQRVVWSESRSEVLDTVLPSPRADMAVAQVGENRVLLVGGNTKQGPTAEILEFTTDTHVVRRLPQRLSRPQADWTAVSVEGSWMIFGGHRFGGISDTVIDLSADGEASILAQRLPYPLRGGSAVVLNRRVYLIGGITPDRVEQRIVRWPW